MRNEGLDIVVVDDNSALVSVLSEIFRECGHDIRAASDGFVALTDIRRRVSDVLLSDLCMPGMTGNELLSVVRRRYPSIRVIAMSGAFSGEAIPSGIAADAFYAKGWSSVAQLIQVVNSVWRNEGHSSRSAVPVWIAEVSIDRVASSMFLVSCPECLRPFPRVADAWELRAWKENCPHCMTILEVALVQQSHGTDGTPISVEPGAAQIRQASMRTRRSDGAPTGRMYQQ